MDEIKKLQTQLPASPVVYEELTIAAVAVGPVSANIERCNYAIVQMQAGPVRYRDDGTAPTALVGWPLFNLDQPTFSVASMRKLQFIRIGATNGLARIRYYI